MIVKPLIELSKKISSGLTPLRSNPEFWDNGTIPWLKTEQLGEKYIYETNEHISEVALEKTAIRLFPVNSLSIAMYGEGKTRGNLSILKKSMATNQACCNIEIDSDKADYEYVYYFLKTQYDELRQLSSGVRKNLNSNDIKNYPIRLPSSLDEQRKIACVLKVLDDKIALNNRINAELEAMAKTLYDYWFVQFDFPNANGKPYKTSGGKMVYNAKLKREIPAGWSSVALSKVTAINNQSLSPADYPSKIFCYYSIPVYDLSKSFSYECGENIGSNKFIVSENDLLVSKLNPWFNRVIYTCFDMDAICSTEFVVWRTSNVLIKNFLYMIATSPQFIEYCTQSATGTSNSHKRVNPDVMMRYEIPFDSNIAEYLGEKLEPIIRKLLINQQENTKLIALRDWLLPLLMNRQVTVK
ncbi:restriction endonuclease subunit S [Escherichia coli]|uniref:restriction endonuclease subunit S n=1 Tax=Escherichia coli TaxID=562 RepID=UPI001C5C8066|nr:restriction endonuclease subunit S [Escherichia coli]EJK1446332.1 restriction endonuclease subunit S [Escherichia coli]EKM1660309.1 restriction endonuclease subunit S [Escherichia coli]EKM1661925.1 restriction endonuclease subunit S [Escherichia coli]EMA2752410.1 restriction endonuclease subunit S [Escherichia coli]MDC9062403.1 restriction endonuclease subunit S [Escherichia coli]